MMVPFDASIVTLSVTEELRGGPFTGGPSMEVVVDGGGCVVWGVEVVGATVVWTATVL